MEERSEIVKKLSEEYKDSVTIKRDTINQKRSIRCVNKRAAIRDPPSPKKYKTRAGDLKVRLKGRCNMIINPCRIQVKAYA